MAAESKPFVLAVYLTFQSEADRDEFLEAWRPLAAWVLQNEPGTLSYEAMIADNDPLKICVFERYASEAAFKEVHRSSEPYQAFRTQQQQWRADKEVVTSGQSYFETGIGYMGR